VDSGSKAGSFVERRWVRGPRVGGSEPVRVGGDSIRPGDPVKVVPASEAVFSSRSKRIFSFKIIDVSG
jgi:hypothetical protein